MEKEHLILHSAMESNILPITSVCDARCVFCSHHDNPEGLRVVSISHRTLEEIKFTLGFLDGRKEITIGESATSINEGEPLCHPEFIEILRAVRERFPNTLISITTNGHGLDEKMVSFLKEVEPLEIKLSLNSATVKGRSILMGDSLQLAEKTIRGVALLHKYKLTFYGSIVAMPHIVGWEDIAETVQYLAENSAVAIRIFMPGYSKKARPELQFDSKIMHQELKHFVDKMVEKVSCPLLMEPSLLTELTPVVSHALKASKAYEAGIQRGDIIKKVNGLVPRSRVEGWNLLQQKGKICGEIERDGVLLNIEWDAEEEGKSGIIMEYDFDMRRMEALKQSIEPCSGQVLVLCSEFAFQVLTAVFQLMELPGGQVAIQPVKNLFFGGSIKAAGLLTVTDFTAAFEEYCSCHPSHPRPDLIIIPEEAFDCQGYDLMRHSYRELAKSTGIDVKLG